MSEETSQKIPTWFWVVAGIALLWNLMGVMAYIGQVLMPPEALSDLPAEQRDYMLNTPAWATGAFAFAVWGGAIGSILLLLRRKFAMIVFIVSLAGILVQMYYNFFVGGALDVYGPGGMIMPVMVLLFGVFLIWLTSFADKKGWMR
jgi:hypothetical protein